MRKRIERSAVEMIEFFENIGWEITGRERKLIKSADHINTYRNIYNELGEEDTQKIEKVINFFYEPEPMLFGIFWDDGDIHRRIGYMEICTDEVDFKYNQYFKGKIVASWNNFKEINSIEELKEICK
jgi:hypothetical protein